MFVDVAYKIFKLANGGLSPVQAVDHVLNVPAEQIADYVRDAWQRDLNYRRLLDDGDDRSAEEAHLPPLGRKHRRHIIYAYMLESTNMLTVFQRVLHEWLYGERLPFATPVTQTWLRTTEQLFFTTPQPPSIASLMSDIRPERGAIRRNAYYRLLGLDLPPGAGDGHSYIKADIANRDFVKAWEQLLYEAWRAYVNVTNSSGPNATDIVGMEELLRELRQMLTARREQGTLTREEKDAITLMGWFHLTILVDSAVVMNLTAQSTSPALRLKKIADLVNVPIQNKTDSFIQLADDTADVLERIEADTITAQDLYAFANTVGSMTQRMLRVITHWSITTGHEIKGVSLRAGSAPQVAASSPSAPAIPLPQTSRFQSVSRV